MTVSDFSKMLRVHNYLVKSDQIEIVQIKDRLNSPTAGGWADLVYLFRLRACAAKVNFRKLAEYSTLIYALLYPCPGGTFYSDLFSVLHLHSSMPH